MKRIQMVQKTGITFKEGCEKYLDDCGYVRQVENGYNGEYIAWYPPYDEDADYGNSYFARYEESYYTIREFDLY